MGSKSQVWYAIRDVAELTGVKPVTLRAWQRRYNLIQPQRSEKGHRLYSQQDIERVQEVQRWLAKGVSIGRVMPLLDENRHSGVEADPRFHSQLGVCNEILQALAMLNRGQADAIIATTLKEYPLDIVEDQFITPTLESIGKMKASQRSLQLCLFQSLLRSRLLFIIEAENKASTKGKMLCMSLESVDSLYGLLWATKKAEQGFHVTLLDGIDDLSGLIGHPGLSYFKWLEVFSNKSLTELQRHSIEKLIADDQSLTVTGAAVPLIQENSLT
jgi:DNA-binding transcriptional MerR regulator